MLGELFLLPHADSFDLVGFIVNNIDGRGGLTGRCMRDFFSRSCRFLSTLVKIYRYILDVNETEKTGETYRIRSRVLCYLE